MFDYVILLQMSLEELDRNQLQSFPDSPDTSGSSGQAGSNFKTKKASSIVEAFLFESWP